MHFAKIGGTFGGFCVWPNYGVKFGKQEDEF